MQLNDPYLKIPHPFDSQDCLIFKRRRLDIKVFSFLFLFVLILVFFLFLFFAFIVAIFLKPPEKLFFQLISYVFYLFFNFLYRYGITFFLLLSLAVFYRKFGMFLKTALFRSCQRKRFLSAAFCFLLSIISQSKYRYYLIRKYAVCFFSNRIAFLSPGKIPFIFSFLFFKPVALFLENRLFTIKGKATICFFKFSKDFFFYDRYIKKFYFFCFYYNLLFCSSNPDKYFYELFF